MGQHTKMYRQKTKYHRVRTNTYTKVYSNQQRMHQKKCLISEWWRKRQMERRVYSPEYAETLEHGKDYYGRLPWPDRVSFRSLYEDFILTEGAGTDISSGEFCIHMHDITKIPAGQKTVRYKVGDWKWIKSLTHLDLPQ